MENKKIASFFLFFLALIPILFSRVAFDDTSNHFRNNAITSFDYWVVLIFLIAVMSLVFTFIDRNWKSKKITVIKILLLIFNVVFVMSSTAYVGWIIGHGSIWYSLNVIFEVLFLASIFFGIPLGIVFMRGAGREKNKKKKNILKKKGILGIASPLVFLIVVVCNGMIDDYLSLRQVYRDAGLSVVEGDRIVDALVRNQVNKSMIISIDKVDGGYDVFTGIKYCDLGCNHHRYYVHQLNGVLNVDYEDIVKIPIGVE